MLFHQGLSQHVQENKIKIESHSIAELGVVNHEVPACRTAN